MKRTLGVLAISALFAGVAWSADGAAVYTAKCKACHSIAGAGGPMAKLGGALDGVGAKRDEAWLKAYFKDPKSKNPKSKMPALKLSAEEWDAVTAYVLTLK